jgi:DNA-binding HxlR family transcriptional regulator
MDTDQVSGRWDATKGACPTRQVLGRIGDTWTMLVISTLEKHGTLRSGQLKTTISYTLTPLGRSLAAAVATMRTWAYDHMDEISAARDEYDAKP